MPVEYTRLDFLVDVMFTAATDVEPVVMEPVLGGEEPSAKQGGEQSGTWEFTDAALMQEKRDQIIATMSSRIGGPLVKKSRALYWNPDHEQRVACTISKRYLKRSGYPYWYAYHPQWREFLGQGSVGFLVLGCMDLPLAFAIPRDQIHAVLDQLNTTDTESGAVKYWHLHIAPDRSGVYELLLPKADRNLSLTGLAVELPAPRSQ
jgi:hypothetical protein